ncbi:hypothetical protein [Chryseobacterium tongliaoense]|uniref:hypothetical protein n=1 Tax=Chryseobacterium tongliaoense TaxID=3240933 RepID=UPI0035191B66
MNTKRILLTFILLTAFSCKMKSQCDIYTKMISENMKNDYSIFLKKQKVNKAKDEDLNELSAYYSKFNDCNRKQILFDFPKDSIFVMEETIEDDYSGTFNNLTSLYRKDEVTILNTLNTIVKTQKVDRDYILNNKYNDGDTYKYILQLKQNKLSGPKTSNCIAMKDRTYISLIIDKKVKKIYRVCSGELIEL